MTPFEKYDTFGKRFLAGLIDGLIFLPFAIVSNRFEGADNRNLYIIIMFLYIMGCTVYVVIGHGKYGQTIGKRLMGIKVLDISEQDVIGYKRAFYREAVWFFAEVIGLIYLLTTVDDSNGQNLNDTTYESYVDITVSVWFLLELITMFFNKKRRALHDFIAGSVVVDLNEMKREDLQKRQEQLLTSIESN
ncbi:MAG: hypothetical protein JWQ96_3537 [Segetibacter sp.]|nr:hypothetical protein [Segetibacter sp.]